MEQKSEINKKAKVNNKQWLCTLVLIAWFTFYPVTY